MEAEVVDPLMEADLLMVDLLMEADLLMEEVRFYLF